MSDDCREIRIVLPDSDTETAEAIGDALMTGFLELGTSQPAIIGRPHDAGGRELLIILAP